MNWKTGAKIHETQKDFGTHVNNLTSISFQFMQILSFYNHTKGLQPACFLLLLSFFFSI